MKQSWNVIIFLRFAKVYGLLLETDLGGEESGGHLCGELSVTLLLEIDTNYRGAPEDTDEVFDPRAVRNLGYGSLVIPSPLPGPAKTQVSKLSSEWGKYVIM